MPAPVSIDFSRLDPTEFEEFCFRLLPQLGFKDLDWRKGTPMGASPADSGRDIEGTTIVRDPDSVEHRQKWFIDCKHYSKGVPPDALQGAIAWATAERPSVLLFIVSGYLSNPSKDFLARYQEQNKPAFRIKVWERPQLEEFASSNARLLLRFNLLDRPVFANFAHPVHFHLLQPMDQYELSDLIEVLRALEPELRTRVTRVFDLSFNSPYLREKREEFAKQHHHILQHYQPTFDELVSTWYHVAASVRQDILVSWLVTHLCQEWLRSGDTSRIAAIEEVIEIEIQEIEATAASEPSGDKDYAPALAILRKMKGDTRRIFETNYDTYIQVIERVVKPLSLRRTKSDRGNSAPLPPDTQSSAPAGKSPDDQEITASEDQSIKPETSTGPDSGRDPEPS